MKDGLPGEEGYDHRAQDYAAYLKALGTGRNQLRTRRVAQPNALKHGDLLANGYAVVGEPRRGYNSSVLLCVTKGMHDVRWLELPSRIPLALAVEEDCPERGYSLPEGLKTGDILANGDEVLREPIWCIDEMVVLRLTGGMTGHEIQVPDSIPIALLTKADEAPEDIQKISEVWRRDVNFPG